MNYFNVRAFDDVFNTWLSYDERAILVSLFDRAKRVLEIGINSGYTARLLLNNITSIESYVGIDVPPDHIARLEMQRTEVPKDAGHVVRGDKRVRLIVRPGGSETVRPKEVGRCDAVLIDGDHSRQAVAYDTALALAVVRHGVIAWHDYKQPPTEVNEVVNDLAKRRPVHRVNGTMLAYLHI